eukprot:TRINITY_DN33442_c0_g2_i1.p1 TRINITY_DN33442_c0_g2~~TRINITY_DN33442_c0_g2_i1.p1  ORF type:complete len:504 (+),score=101.17 TRINITY_DN33442_c0_g2_i1:238-1749(+)
MCFFCFFINSFMTCGFHDTFVPPECDSSYWKYNVGSCTTDGNREITFEWKLPLPSNSSTAWDCNDGLPLPETATVSCEYLVADSDYGMNIVYFSVFGVIAILSPIFFIQKYRRKRVINNGQPIFMQIGLLGGILMSIAPLLFLGRPQDATCVGSVMFMSIGFTITQGALFAKIYRIYKIFNNKKLKRHRMRNSKLLRQLLMLIGNDVFFLSLWIITESPGAKIEAQEHDGFVVEEITCDYGSGLFYIIILMKIMMVLAPCYLSWKIRTIPDRFNEGKNIFFTTYASMLIITVCSSFVVSMDMDTDLQLMVIGAAIVLTALCSHLPIILPKMIAVCKAARTSSSVGPASSVTMTTNASSTTAGSRRFDDMSSREMVDELEAAHKKIKELQIILQNQNRHIRYHSVDSTAAKFGSTDSCRSIDISKSNKTGSIRYGNGVIMANKTKEGILPNAWSEPESTDSPKSNARIITPGAINLKDGAERIGSKNNSILKSSKTPGVKYTLH